MSFVTNDILAHVDINTTYMEMHNLAYFYHWGRDECLHCPCSQRGVYNDQIKQQVKAESTGGKTSPTPGSGSPKYKENHQ